jgi:hypothetical protein
MQIDSNVARVMGEEWVQLLLPGFAEREAKGFQVVVNGTHVRVRPPRNRVYNHKTDAGVGGARSTP